MPLVSLLSKYEVSQARFSGQTSHMLSPWLVDTASACRCEKEFSFSIIVFNWEEIKFRIQYKEYNTGMFVALAGLELNRWSRNDSNSGGQPA